MTALRTSCSSILLAWSRSARCKTVRQLVIFPVRMNFATSAENFRSSARRYCSRRRRTFPETGPWTLARNRPCSDQETYCHIVFGAKTHQIRAAGDIAEADNPADGMDRHTEADLSLHLDDNRFPFLGEVGPLCGHKKGIEMFFHGSLNHSCQITSSPSDFFCDRLRQAFADQRTAFTAFFINRRRCYSGS